VTAPTIELPPLAAPVDELWHVLLDLGEELTAAWALVGGQMVLRHALEHGRVPPQISQDGDVVADVRTRPSAVQDVVDVLGPEGLPADTQLLVTAPPNRTIEVPGGTQALARTETVTVIHEGHVSKVPRPAASGVDHDPARHLRDLALLCVLVEDPFEMRAQLIRNDLRRLRQIAALHDPAHPAWALVPEDIRSNGQATLTILTG
jgi:hypothetical protein